MVVESGDGALTTPPSLVEQQEPEAAAAAPVTAPIPAPAPAPAAAPRPGDHLGLHAGPSVRRTARELGVDLTRVTGTGPKGRITKDDLLTALRGPAAAEPAAPAAGAGIRRFPRRTSPGSARSARARCRG